MNNKNEEARMKQEYERQRAREDLQTAYTNEQIFNGLSEENNDFLQITLDNSNVLQQVEMHLRGQVYATNKEGSRVKIQKFPPVLNEEGVQSMMQALSPRIGKNVIMANLTQEAVTKITVGVARTTIQQLMAYSDKYELDRVKRSSLVLEICDMVYFSLTRALARAEAKEVYGRTKAIEHLQRTQAEESKKGFGGFF